VAACAQPQIAVQAGRAAHLPATGGGRLGLAVGVVAGALLLRFAIRRPRSTATLDRKSVV